MVEWKCLSPGALQTGVVALQFLTHLASRSGWGGLQAFIEYEMSEEEVTSFGLRVLCCIAAPANKWGGCSKP